MALIPEDKIAEVRDRTDIVAVIGEHVALKKSGINHKGLCPFHGENTPSFNVNSQKQMFHCFGCGKSGDVINFMMETEGKPFLEVVRLLAKRAGIDLPEPQRKSPDQLARERRTDEDRSRLLRVHQLAVEFYRAEYASVRGGRARAHVEGRGIDPATVESFQIGYAPAGWDALVRFFESKKVPHEVAEKSGLVRRRDNVQLQGGVAPTKSTHFDMFRDRVMCPLINPNQEVLAFSGRLLDGDGPKYINSPETSLYKKGENLYGLHLAKSAIRRTTRAILVEGNFDVLAMHCRGFGETVAPMGTALTAAQVRLLHRFGPGRVMMFLDGDGAGLRAAAKDVSLFLDEDLLAFVALLPKGDDPDTFLRKNGKDGVELVFKSAKEAVEYFCAHAWQNKGTSVIERVKMLEEEAAPMIRKVKIEAARRRYAERLSLELSLPIDTIERAVRGGGAIAYAATEPEQTHRAVAAPPETPKLSPADLELLALLADHPRLMMRLRPLNALRALESDRLREALTKLVGGAASATTSATLDARRVADIIDPLLRSQVVEAMLSGRYADVVDPERALMDMVRKNDNARLSSEHKLALAALRGTEDPEKVRELTARIKEIEQQRRGLKGSVDGDNSPPAKTAAGGGER